MSPTVGVCGFGRCGSTMVMRMLDVGGLPPCDSTYLGSYELPQIAAAFRFPPSTLAGHSIKLLDAVLVYGMVPAAHEWRFVWIDRDHVQQAASTVKFLSALGVPLTDDAAERLVASYVRDRPRAINRLRRSGPVTVLHYDRALADPRRGARKLRQVWPDLDVSAAAAAVMDRDGKCRPDLTVEIELSVAEQ